ncbi:MAG: RNA-binding protein [Bacteroidales bacterium]|nr:RNA-binding protein [Bacteroidales bacterium]
MNIFVSSLSFKAKKEDLIDLFAPYGEVLSARIILNKETRRSRGYGFVEMASQEEGEAAIVALNGSEHMGRTINVAVAHDRPAAPVAPVEEPEAENENEPKD